MKLIRRNPALAVLLALTGALALPLAAADQPFRGNGSGAITSAVPAGTLVEMTTIAEGRATLIGNYSRSETLQLDTLTGAFTGNVAFTAANGDVLEALMTGQFVSPTSAAGTYTFDGGTGRFTDANGEADFVVTTEDGVHFDVSFRGVVTGDPD